MNILGTEYKVKKMTRTECPKLELKGAVGLCEFHSKEIIIDSEMNPKSGTEWKEFEKFEKEVIRHETVHAFFHESGLNEYSNDEVLVDWIAVQIGKMAKTMKEAECWEEII